MKLLIPSRLPAFVIFLALISSGQDGRAAGAHDSTKGKVLSLVEFGKAGVGGDDTAVFRKALAEASKQQREIQIPATRLPYRIAPLNLPSHTTVLLDSGVVIQALPGFSDGQKLLNIADANTVQIIGYGASLKMNRAEYKSGEYRHCLSINGSRLVAIRGITCVSPGGNGVYIGGSDRTPFSEDIIIEDLKTVNSVRSGLQVVSVRNLTIRRSRFEGSHGLEKTGSPKKAAGEKVSGIEIYPNGPGARLENIRIEDSVTSHSEGDGFQVVLNHLTDASKPVSMTILRHHDVSSGGSSFLGADDPAVGKPVRGSLLFEDCYSESAQEYGAVFSFWNSSGPRVVFRGLTVINPNGDGTTMDNVAVAVKRGGGGRDPIGNVEFIRPTIRDTRQPSKLDYYFSFADYSHIGMKNVIFRDPVHLSGARHKEALGLFQGEGSQQIQHADDPEVLELWRKAEKRDAASH